MASTAIKFRLSELTRRQATALERKARRMGLSAGDYVKQLIEDDLALDQKARTTPLGALAAPFRKALHGASEAEIDRIVVSARSRRR